MMVDPPFANGKLNAVPLQTSLVWFPITGFAFTLTTTLKGVPGQLPAAPDFGVTLYVNVARALVVLVKR